jgi:L,D-peptidoglycan transpeptidase YkuD (ErfK/YbiS/YcfS/YnhG family)
MRFILTVWLLTLCLSGANAQLSAQLAKLPDLHRQLVVVTAGGWHSTTASLQRYEKKGNAWQAVGQQIEVSLGKKGLAWGRGLHNPGLAGPEKVEGDGRAPAGIFEFGTAFGYSAAAPKEVKIPYRQAGERDYWVDAIASPAYNSWVTIAKDQENTPRARWSSVERMKRADHLYELGLVVKHNMEPAVPGKGSAIFLHVWRTPGAPTLGCTAMRKEDLSSLLAWLDPDKHPLLIQAPQEEMDGLL